MAKKEIMMRIGLITYHGAHNYGSALQAYALSTKLTSLGHDVEVINLRTPAQRALYPLIAPRGRGVKRLIHAAYAQSHRAALRRRFNAFEQFTASRLRLTPEYSSPEELARAGLNYDALVCGSDQVWNPQCPDFETSYFLDFASRGTRTLSYAPSLGTGDLSNDELRLIRSLIPNIDFISVREEHGAEVLRRMTDRDVDVVCDPVLLLEAESWSSLLPPPRYSQPYILTYFLENNHGSQDIARYLRSRTGYQVVTLTENLKGSLQGFRPAFDAGPEDFLGLIHNASMVVTNSFHGTLFSLIFRKPFITTVGVRRNEPTTTNDIRKIEFLRNVGLEAQILFRDSANPDPPSGIDFASALAKVWELRGHSERYLRFSLDGATSVNRP